MFSEKFIAGMKRTGIFILIYTVVFVVLAGTFTYTFPFIAAFLIALMIHPAKRFMQIKMKMGKSIPSLILSLLVYIIFFGLITLLFFKIVDESKQLITLISTMDTDFFMEPLKNMIASVSEYFKAIDPKFIEENSTQITSAISNSAAILGKSLNAFVSIAFSIPMAIAVVFIIILSTYFFSRDMNDIKEKALLLLSDSGRKKFTEVWSQSLIMLFKYIKAYSFIFFLTFVQTLTGFLILRVRYAVILSLVCMFADVLPALGIAVIYFPLIIINLMQANYFAAVGLIVLYVIITVVRQVVEPKIVADSIGIHPVLVLGILYIGFKAMGIIGVIYLMLLVVLFKIFKAAKVI